MTAGAAMVGIMGVGLGLWWADAVAAAIISLSVIRDGFGNLRDVITDLMDEAPKTTDHSDFDPLPDRLECFVRTLPWVCDAQVRLREEGHVLVGEVFVVPVDSTNLVERLDEATRQCVAVDWRLHDIVLVPVSGLAAAAATPGPG
jgi:divalent metal cation (Fe/Co/Zn/Cd) transporter